MILLKGFRLVLTATMKGGRTIAERTFFLIKDKTLAQFLRIQRSNFKRKLQRFDMSCRETYHNQSFDWQDPPHTQFSWSLKGLGCLQFEFKVRPLNA